MRHLFSTHRYHRSNLTMQRAKIKSYLFNFLHDHVIIPNVNTEKYLVVFSLDFLSETSYPGILLFLYL